MKHTFLSLSTGLALAGLSTSAQAVTLFTEDFDDATVGYTLGKGIDGVNGPAIETADGTGNDYFGRVGGTGGLTINATSNSYANVSGGFFAAQDLDTTGPGDPNITSDVGVMFIQGIDITNYGNFTFSISLAENDLGNVGPSALDWDPDMSFIIEYRIDGGSYNKLLAVESSNNSGNDFSAAIDTDFDGLGDGPTVSNAFTSFNNNDHGATINATGSQLDLRISMTEFGATGEDIAFDNIQLEADLVPEPSSTSLLGLGGLALLLRRRR